VLGSNRPAWSWDNPADEAATAAAAAAATANHIIWTLS